MDKKTTGIIATVATGLLCGCPGLIGLCMGLMFVVVGGIPGSNIDVFGSSDPKSAMTFGIVSLCLSIIFIAIPIVVGFLSLRKKPSAGETVTPNEPIPPAS
jgi:hypothetical protein